MGRRPERTDEVAAPIAKRRAVLLQNEVADYRASTINALEAHPKEDSRESCCHRSGRSGIATVCTFGDGRDSQARPRRDEDAPNSAQGDGALTRDPRNLHG